MDLSVRRVLEALLPGPATPRILVVSYGMGIDESEAALAEAIDQGLARPRGPVAFELTDDGRAMAEEVVAPSRLDRAGATADLLDRRARTII